jgi:hypothetical protein
LKIASASTSISKTDTLVLDGAQLSFDFTTPTSVGATIPNITSIEKVDITGTGNNSIKLSLASLMQADGTDGAHKLYINGDSGDTVMFTLDNTHTSIAHDTAALNVNGTNYWVYHIGTDELLVQTAINNINVNG